MRVTLHRSLLWALCSTGCASAHEAASELDPSRSAPPSADASVGLDATSAAADATTSAPDVTTRGADAPPRAAPGGGSSPVVRPDASTPRDARADDSATRAAWPLDARAAPDTPPDWRCVQGECGLRLCAPQDMVAIPAAGIDSCVAQFRTLDCSYTGDIGPNYGESHLDDYPEYAFDYVRVGGVVGRLVTYRTAGSARSFAAALELPALPSERAGVFLGAACETREARDMALRVLQAVELPMDVGPVPTLQPTTPDCTGFDERPLQGWVLGGACVGPKVSVPGVCAVGAKTGNQTQPGGRLRCLLSPRADYFWAYVPYVEGVIGSDGGARMDGFVYGWGQLTEAEYQRCRELAGRLTTVDGGVADAAAGEPDYVRCP